MSIREEWQRLVAEGILHEVEAFPGDASNRTVLVSNELHDLLAGPWDGEQGKRCSRLAATLQEITTTETIVAEMNPYKARKARMGRLDPVND